MIRFSAIVALLVALVAAVLVADRPLPRADFVFVNQGGVTTIDPQRMSWQPDLRMGRLLHEGLVRHDVLDHDFGIIPAAAESWLVSPDGLTYTFTIRPDATWSNGEPVLADDFVYSWRRALLPDLASDYSTMFLMIEGAQAFYDWRTRELDALSRGESEHADGLELWAATERRFTETVSLESVEERTLRFRLEQPVPYFLDLCAFGVFAPVYPPLVSAYERPDPQTGRIKRRTGWTKPGELVVNGPFVPVRWRFKREMRLEQNPHYWNRDALNIRTIALPSIDDPNAAVLAFKTGAADYLTDVSAGYRGDIVREKLAFRAEHADAVAAMEAEGLDPFEIDRRLPDDPRKYLHMIPAFGTYFWNFNCQPTLPDGRPNPFADARVRRAFALVTDKRAVAEEVRRLGEPIARTLIPPGSLPGYTPPEGLPCISDARTPEEADALIARARALLAEAGYPNPATDFPITVDLVFNKDSGHDLIAQVLAKNWQRALGVQVSLSQKELKVYRQDLKDHNFITSRAGWFGDYPDATTFLDICKTGDGNNDRGFSSPRFDALLDQAATERDREARLEILQEAERVLMEEELPMIPIFFYVQLSMFDPQKVTGLSTHPQCKQNLFLVDVLGDSIGRDEPRPMHRRSD